MQNSVIKIQENSQNLIENDQLHNKILLEMKNKEFFCKLRRKIKQQNVQLLEFILRVQNLGFESFDDDKIYLQQEWIHDKSHQIENFIMQLYLDCIKSSQRYNIPYLKFINIHIRRKYLFNQDLVLPQNNLLKASSGYSYLMRQQPTYSYLIRQQKHQSKLSNKQAQQSQLIFYSDILLLLNYTKFKNLQFLRIQKMSLTNIQPLTFLYCPNLQWLYLRQNNITSTKCLNKTNLTKFNRLIITQNKNLKIPSFRMKFDTNQLQGVIQCDYNSYSIDKNLSYKFQTKILYHTIMGNNGFSDQQDIINQQKHQLLRQRKSGLIQS